MTKTSPPAKISITAKRIELRLLDGAPSAMIYADPNIEVRVDAPLLVALIWCLRDGKRHSRHSVSDAIYGANAGDSLKHLIGRLTSAGGYQCDGMLERTPTHLQILVDVITDRMRIRGDVDDGQPLRALERYRASPVDAQRRARGPNGVPSREVQLASVYEEMAKDGLEGFCEAVQARLVHLAAGATSSELDQIEDLLHKHAPEAEEAEPLFDLIAGLRSAPRRAHQHGVLSALAEGDGKVAPPEPLLSATPTLRQRRLPRLAAAAIVVVVAASSWAAPSRPAAPTEHVTALTRLAVLDDSGEVTSFSIGVDEHASLVLATESSESVRSLAWRQGIADASALNDVRLDPAASDMVVQAAGERGVDLSYLHDDGSLASIVRAPEDDYGEVFSADGRWMAYASARGSTKANYDVDVWLRDRWTGAEHRMRGIGESYEHPLRFDAASGQLWLSSDHRAARAPELCRVTLATERWECHRVSNEVSSIVGMRDQTVWLADLLWTSASIRVRTGVAVDNVGCTVHPTVDVAACVTTAGAIALIDGRHLPAWLRMVSTGKRTPQRAFFLPVVGERLWRLEPSDVIRFGIGDRSVAVSAATGLSVTLAPGDQWQRGILVGQELASDRAVTVTGAVTLPMTGRKWQSASAAIGQLPLREARSPRAVAGDSVPGGIDGFTRSAAWEATVCRLDIPSSREPQEPGTVMLRGRTVVKSLSAPLAGKVGPVPFALMFDGRDTCVAHVGESVLSIPTRIFPSRPLFVTVTGRAEGTTGYVSGLTIRGAVAPASH